MQMQMQQPGYPVVQSLPGMPPLPQGVSVHISNVVGGSPYPQQQLYAPYPQQHPQQAMQPYPVSHEQPTVMGMMRDDAAQRTMEVVQRAGPAKMLAYGVGAGALVSASTIALLIPLGMMPLGMVGVMVPLILFALVAFYFGARAGRGTTSHHLEQTILRHAQEHDGVFRIVTLATATGRPLRECQMAVDAMVASGHATVDADDQGGLVYRIPDLEPAKKRVVYEARAAQVTEIDADVSSPERRR